MKKFILLCVSVLILAGCANKPYVDNLAPYRKLTARQLYTGALQNMRKENYNEATKQFNAMDSLYPFGPYAQKGQLDTIYAYYMNDDKLEAEVAADRYIHLYPQGNNVDYAYYMKGLVNYRQGLSWLQRMWGVNPASRQATNMQVSFAAFNQLVQRFPNSQYTNDALLRMAYIRNILAEHQLAVAQYYMKRKAYVAVVNRINYVIENFSGSSSIQSALLMGIKAYKKLGLPNMMHQYQEIYQLNFGKVA
jgi:outer membrane protein assembly factor BamD